MKGVLLAGGSGTRLDPLTRAVNKHLLPVYSRPMIFYPLATLRALGVEDVLLITRSEDQAAFAALLGDGVEHGVRLTYAVQSRPAGIAEGLLIGEEFAEDGPMALALGDNLYVGSDPGQWGGGPLASGARVFVRSCPNPTEYAVLEMDETGPVAIEEKPARPRSDLAVTGLYLFDGRAAEVARTLRPSARGELEIVDVLGWYMERGELDARVLPPGIRWADLGTFDRLLAAGVMLQHASRQELAV